MIAKLIRITLMAVAVAGHAGGATAESYPAKPIRLLVSFPPGGSTDVVARSIQPLLESRLGRPVVIENRPGAGGTIGVDAVAKAAPDGYVLGLAAAGALAINVSLQEKMPYDPVTDLVPISLLAAAPFVLVAPASFQGSLQDVIALARAKPGTLSLGHGGNGSAMHLTAQLLNHMAGVSITFVPYRGSSPVASDVLAGHVPFGVVDVTSSLALVRAGQIKAIAVSSARRATTLPDVPTFAEAGLPGYESIGWFGIVAPAGTPPEIVAILNQAIVGVLKDPAIEERIRTVGAEPMASTPEEFAQFIRSEIAKWAKVVALSGARGP